MSGGPQIAMLADGRRLHLAHGPIDLIVEAFGSAAEVAAGYRQAAAAFDGLLAGIVAELELLRRPVSAATRVPENPVARRMVAAVAPHRAVFVTPMAAVAGAVADEVLAALVLGRDLRRAYVNNGGDIALHLCPGERFAAGIVGRQEAGIVGRQEAGIVGRQEAGIVGRQEAPALDAIAAIDAAMPVRGIATSGRGGRSLSLGIADAVTVLAGDAAAADAAATLLANAVDVDDPAVRRRPACEVDDMTDLGGREVTVSVGRLGPETVAWALSAGVAAADAMRAVGHIHAAVLMLAGETRAVGAAGRLAPLRAPARAA